MNVACEMFALAYCSDCRPSAVDVPGLVDNMPDASVLDDRLQGTTVHWSGRRQRVLERRHHLLDAMAGAKAMNYRKLFDGRAATPTMTADELLSLCANIRSYH